MNLHNYFARLESILRSRRDIHVLRLDTSVLSEVAVFEAEIEFPDGSRLYVIEGWIRDAISPVCDEYVYHYQTQEGRLIFSL